MEKALLEEHVRYGEARFRDKELVRPFVNRIYQDLAEIESVMKPKTCEWCKHSKVTISSVICGKNGTYKEADDYCKYFMPKDNA